MLNIFAWILWSWLLLIFIVHLVMLGIAIWQYKKTKVVTVNIDIPEVFFNVACFVFLSFFLFG